MHAQGVCCHIQHCETINKATDAITPSLPQAEGMCSCWQGSSSYCQCSSTSALDDLALVLTMNASFNTCGALRSRWRTCARSCACC